MFEDKIEKVALRCEGCAISVASGSMLTELVEGKSLEEVKRITARVKDLLKGEDLPDDLDLGDVEALQGLDSFPYVSNVHYSPGLRWKTVSVSGKTEEKVCYSLEKTRTLKNKKAQFDPSKLRSLIMPG